MHKFEPKLGARSGALVAQPNIFSGLSRIVGSAYHIVIPQVLGENSARIREVTQDLLDNSRIFYAQKANQSKALTIAAQRSGLSIDVASLSELEQALIAGFNGNQILATGPKNRSFLRLAMLQGATIGVDSLDELASIIELHLALNLSEPTRVLVRLNIPAIAGDTRIVSRFGLSRDELEQALRLFDTNRHRVTFLGWSFHLDSSSESDRITAISYCLDVSKLLSVFHLTASVLDIGGGLRQVFAADIEAWHESVIELKRAVLENDDTVIWPGTTFGYRREGAKLTGLPVFHKYGNAVGAAEQLRALLTSQLASHDSTVAQAMNDHGLELWLELGKSLVDQAGLTVANVEHKKTLHGGQRLIGLNIKRDDIVPMDQEVMLDPIHIPAQPVDSPPMSAFLSGNLCLERDLISYRSINFMLEPSIGDHLVFANTAAYQMDLSASTALMHQKLPKLAVYWQDDDDLSKPQWCLDASYGEIE